MRYMMKQKLFSWGDDYYIKDSTGQDRFFVDGKAISFGSQLSFQDLAGNELCFIKEVVFSLSSTYEIYKGGQLWATVQKELFTFFHTSFDIEEEGKASLEAEGDFTDHSYVFSRNGQQVAEVSMEFFTIADTYGVEIIDGEEDILILACTVIIDLGCHHKE
jgi:uncharacterized protein YxjI